MEKAGLVPLVHEAPTRAREALDRIQTMLSGRSWFSAGGLVAAIADVMRESGREIKEAGINAPRWDA